MTPEDVAFAVIVVVAMLTVIAGVVTFIGQVQLWRWKRRHDR